MSNGWARTGRRSRNLHSRANKKKKILIRLSDTMKNDGLRFWAILCNI